MIIICCTRLSLSLSLSPPLSLPLKIIYMYTPACIYQRKVGGKRPGNKSGPEIVVYQHIDVEELGCTKHFDRKFTVKPYLSTLAREARFRASRVARLSQHLPHGQLLRQLGSGILTGKLAHYLPVVARPRLPGSTGPIPEALVLVQVAINIVARSVVGHRREDHISIVDLLKAAKFL
jgi:hypothetical protein